MTIIENKLADENVSGLKGSRQRHKYEAKSLNNRKFYTRNNFFTRVLTEIVCILFFDIVPLLRNTLGPPVHNVSLLFHGAS